MQKLNSIKHFGFLLCCVSGISLADNVTVYRWVDKNNVVHFSQNQPSHDNYTELTLSNIEKKRTESQETAVNKQAEEPLKIAGSTEKCEEAKANVRTLEAYDKIQYTDGKGTVQVLSELEKEQQLEINKKHVEVYCGE